MTSHPETFRQPGPAAGAAPFAAQQSALEGLRMPAGALVVVGVLGFAAALALGDRARAWQAFLVNLLYFMGIAQAAVAGSAAFYLTQGRWAGTAHFRLAEAFANFIPVGFVLFWGLYFGRRELFPWVLHPVPDKAAWLNVPFLFTRDGLALAVLTVLSFYFLRLSRAQEAARWSASPQDIVLPPAGIRRLAPAVAICYVVVYTLLAFDLVMSLAPLWRSTLFGWYFVAGSFWSALVAMSFTAVLLGRYLGPGSVFEQRRVFHDLGKLIFAFSIFWVYLVFAQYIVIWYGDIPVETFFIIRRANLMPWAALAWTVLLLVWGLPFFVLLGRKPKETPAILGTICLLGLVGIWLERYVLVVPSLSPETVPFGWVELAVSAGFLGLFTLCALPGLRRVCEAAWPAGIEAGERVEAAAPEAHLGAGAGR